VSKITPLKAYIKCRTHDNRFLSLQLVLWPNGGVGIELAERKASGWYVLEKGYTTIGQVFDFWVYLGKILAKRGVSTQAILNHVLDIEADVLDIDREVITS
jgi:hypothetical protein